MCPIRPRVPRSQCPLVRTLAAYVVLVEPRRRRGKAEGGTADVGEGVAGGVEMLRNKALIAMPHVIHQLTQDLFYKGMNTPGLKERSIRNSQRYVIGEYG